MSQSQIKPGEITKPIQIIAVWFVVLLSLVGILLTSARLIQEPAWVSPTLVVAAIAIIPIFSMIIFRLQTKFRKELLDDPNYAEWLKVQEEFKDFKPEKIQASPEEALSVVNTADESWEERERKRIQRYEKNRGLFLIHTWRPSQIAEEGADVSINLVQHGDGPLTQGKVKSVEYHLGPKFFTHTITKTSRDDNFALRISAYGSMLCVARVHFDDGSAPLDLERYINF